jgi:tRNA(fMet)-specific endonuclease VapC
LRVFDTSFIIDLSNNDPGAINLARIVDQDKSAAAISVISVHEYFFGIQLRYFRDEDVLKSKLEAAEKELAAFIVLPITQEIAAQSARIQAVLTKHGRIIGINDIYIATTAIVHKSSVVTRNSSDFEQVQGLSVEKY